MRCRHLVDMVQRGPAGRSDSGSRGTGVPERIYTDLDALAGSWVDVPGFDDAIEDQDRVEEALWR